MLKILICFFYKFKNNLQIKFRFEQQEHKGLVFGFRYIDKTIDLPKNLEDIKEDFENYFGNYKTYPNAPCNKKYEGFEDWQNLNTLEKIHYGNFKEDFEDKIKKMLSILE